VNALIERLERERDMPNRADRQHRGRPY